MTIGRKKEKEKKKKGIHNARRNRTGQKKNDIQLLVSNSLREDILHRGKKESLIGNHKERHFGNIDTATEKDT